MKNSIKKTLIGMLGGAVLTVGAMGIGGCECVNKDIKTARQTYSNLYEAYKEVNLKNLTLDEKEVLENTKKAYGIPVSVSTLKNEDPDFKECIKSIDEIKAITGKDKFDQKELILLYRQIKDYAGLPAFY